MKTNILKQIGLFLSKNSSTILTALGVVGVGSTAIISAKCTPNAMALVDVAETNNKSQSELTKVEVVKAAWKAYIPAYLIGIGTIACVVGAHVTDKKRIAAISSAYALTDAAFSKYKENVKQVIGKNKAKSIDDKIASEKAINSNSDKDSIIICGGDTLCYDSYGDRYFRSNIEKLRSIENRMNKELLTAMWISLNDVYFEMGLKPVKYGDDLGWSIDGKELIDFHFSTFLANDSEPCITVNFEVEPK